MRFKPRRSSPRLPSFEYQGSYAYHLILATRNRAPLFEDGCLAASCLECLTLSVARYGFEIVAYCFMPDHLHLLVAGSEDAPLIRFVQHFKQATGYRRPGLWQRSYYDHVLRDEEVLEEVAWYIWGNPARAGLAQDVIDYPYSGPRERIEAYGKPEDRAKALSLRGGSLRGAPHQGYIEGEVPAWKR